MATEGDAMALFPLLREWLAASKEYEQAVKGGSNASSPEWTSSADDWYPSGNEPDHGGDVDGGGGSGGGDGGDGGDY